ncbi:baseplate J/gp47 family protein [Shinella zoogloeoides]|uniref:baseplate J/gp47 family protein n=1 Tax=Shinella zoogloeoides TaxID=352475 RepID=UPI0028A96805|nr:baseplate J/gp47 family protein [Shinella zoogloeoides]
MAWSIRSLAEASQAIRGAFRQHLPGTDTALKNNFVTVVTKVLAGMSQEFELRMGFVARQLFARTASLPFLLLHAADVGMQRKPASAAIGIVDGTGEPSAIYPAGIRLVSGNNTYVSRAPAQAGLTGRISISVAAEEKGAFTNRDAGGLLTLSDPGLYPSLSLNFTVGAEGLGGGADIEDIEELRGRVLFRKANPPGAGKLTDYERIVRDVPGVLKAWAFRDGLTPSFLVVFFLFEGRPNRIPTEGDRLVVQAAIDAMRLIRVNDSVVEAPTPEALNPVIANLSGDSADVRARIETAIDAVLYERARPGVAGDVFWLSRSWIAEAISSVVGEDRHELQWPLDDLPFTNGRYPVLGAVSFV